MSKKRISVVINRTFLFFTIVFAVIAAVLLPYYQEHHDNYGRFQNAMFILSRERQSDKFRELFNSDYTYLELLDWVELKLDYVEIGTSIPRSLDPYEIMELGRGRCEEYSILYIAACYAHGYEARLVASFPPDDHTWAEVMVNSTWLTIEIVDRFVSDPYRRYDLGYNVTKVIAFVPFTYIDVTESYVRTRD